MKDQNQHSKAPISFLQDFVYHSSIFFPTICDFFLGVAIPHTPVDFEGLCGRDGEWRG